MVGEAAYAIHGDDSQAYLQVPFLKWSHYVYGKRVTSWEALKMSESAFGHVRFAGQGNPPAGSPEVSSGSTLRRRELSRRLRQMREQRGHTADWVAQEARRLSGKPRGWSESKVSRLENADWKRLKAEDVRLLLEIYKITDVEERDRLLVLAREAGQQDWWQSYEDVVGEGQFVGLEAEALALRTYQSTSIPGLLQTESYARSMIRASGITDSSELDRRVEVRMFRKHVFNRERPPTVWAVIDEAALWRMPEEVRPGQVEHLLQCADRPSVGVQVLPFSAGFHAAMAGQLVIMEFQPPASPAVYLEAMYEEIYREKPEQVALYMHVYDHVQSQALPTEESKELLRGLLSR